MRLSSWAHGPRGRTREPAGHPSGLQEDPARPPPQAPQRQSPCAVLKSLGFVRSHFRKISLNRLHGDKKPQPPSRAGSQMGGTGGRQAHKARRHGSAQGVAAQQPPTGGARARRLPVAGSVRGGQGASPVLGALCPGRLVPGPGSSSSPRWLTRSHTGSGGPLGRARTGRGDLSETPGGTLCPGTAPDRTPGGSVGTGAPQADVQQDCAVHTVCMLVLTKGHLFDRGQKGQLWTRN